MNDQLVGQWVDCIFKVFIHQSQVYKNKQRNQRIKNDSTWRIIREPL